MGLIPWDKFVYKCLHNRYRNRLFRRKGWGLNGSKHKRLLCYCVTLKEVAANSDIDYVKLSYMPDLRSQC